MENGKDVSLTISNEVVQPIVNAKIQAAIVAALGDEKALIAQLIDKALGEKVNSKGKVSNYSSDNKYTLLEAVTREAIQQAATDAFKEHITQSKKQILDAVKKHLIRSNNKIAKMLVDSFTDATKHDFLFKVVIEPRKSNY